MSQTRLQNAAQEFWLRFDLGYLLLLYRTPRRFTQVIIQGSLGLRLGNGARVFAMATLDGKSAGKTAVGSSTQDGV